MVGVWFLLYRNAIALFTSLNPSLIADPIYRFNDGIILDKVIAFADCKPEHGKQYTFRQLHTLYGDAHREDGMLGQSVHGEFRQR